MLEERKIVTLDDFIDSVIQLSSERKDWDTAQFMQKIQNKIINAIKGNKIVVGSQVAIGFFHLYALLPRKTSQDRIRAAALSLKSWLR